MEKESLFTFILSFNHKLNLTSFLGWSSVTAILVHIRRCSLLSLE